MIIIRGDMLPIYRDSGERVVAPSGLTQVGFQNHSAPETERLEVSTLKHHGLFEGVFYVLLDTKTPLPDPDPWFYYQLESSWTDEEIQALKDSGFPSLKDYITGDGAGFFKHNIEQDIKDGVFLLAEIPKVHRWVWVSGGMILQDNDTYEFEWTPWTTIPEINVWPVIIPTSEAGSMNQWIFRSVGASEMLMYSETIKF
eukprot:599083-Amphidinium_carterae.1